MLICPKCQVNNKLVRSEEKGIELDHCENCGGIWFDKGELNKIIDDGIELTFDHIKKKATPMMEDYQVGMCPVCVKVMEKAPDRKIANLMMDICPKCKGIWLDGGEFQRLNHKEVMHKIRNYIL